jgi:uncharacterized protein YjiS (DUF1127 family)
MHKEELVMNGQIHGKAVLIGLQRNQSRSPLARYLRDAASAAFERLLAWQDRARSRRMLRGLDDHMLHDIGIDRGMAESEGSMPFWR